MGQRIEIRNFRQIKHADIDINNIVVLIGEQATGKSTIAKLIYFFKRLKGDFYKDIIQGYFEKNQNTPFLPYSEILLKQFVSYYETLIKSKFVKNF